MASSTNPSFRPTVAIIQLRDTDYFYANYSDLVKAIRSKADVCIVESLQVTSEIFQNVANFPIILVTDGTLLSDDCAAERSKAVEYVRNGGTLAFGCRFPYPVKLVQLNRLFGELGLPWVYGDYAGDSFKLNPAMSAVSHANLPDGFSDKTQNIAEVKLENQLYLSQEAGDDTQTSAAFTNVGEGKVGYVGIVNPGGEPDAIVLAMLGLNI